MRACTSARVPEYFDTRVREPEPRPGQVSHAEAAAGRGLGKIV